MLKGKTVLLGVTGSIAAYKIASLASMLVKQHADVHVIMTKNSTNFISPITFETLTNNRCQVETFDRNFEFHVAHVSLGVKADMMLIAPATANVIGKLAHGIADDMLTTTVLACKAPILVAPAMNTNMYENKIVQDNLKKIKEYGMEVIEPAKGRLACGTSGEGKMPEPEVLFAYIMKTIACEKDLQGKKILITAGATQETIDPVRFISNHSTGKMGYALAKAAMLRGGEVTLVTAAATAEPPAFVQTISVRSAEEMYQEVTQRREEQDIIIKAAAVADYTPAKKAEEKLKKKEGDMEISLTRTKDILKFLGEHKREGQFLCGFSMETENMMENSRRKRKEKNLDMIVANNLKVEGAGFGGDTNVVTLITETKEIELPKMAKEEVAHKILDEILAKIH